MNYNVSVAVPAQASPLLFGLGFGVGVIMVLIWIAVIVFMVVSYWKLFKKASKPGWAAIVPIYNIVVTFEIVGLSPWIILLVIGLIIPIINFLVAIAWIIIYIVLCYRLAKVFGHNGWFAVGIYFVSIVFVPIMAFSDDKYLGVGMFNKTNLPPQIPPTQPNPPTDGRPSA
jgi:hypothetical protein